MDSEGRWCQTAHHPPGSRFTSAKVHWHPPIRSSAETDLNVSINNQVIRARELLGARLTAYLVGRNTTNMDDLTDDEKVDLRLSLAITKTLNAGRANMSGATTSTWWKGMNPMLGDHAPAQVLRAGNWVAVMGAAKHDSNA